jgi:membrane-associated phospholipid phosphatase
MTTLTDFGDITTLIPLSAIMLLWLVAARSVREACWWLIGLLLSIGGTALLKIYFLACPLDPQFTNPSGHASSSTLIYGGFAVVVAAELAPGWRRAVCFGAAGALVAAICLSRVILRMHSVGEVMCGLAIGFLALTAFAQGYRYRRPTDVSLMFLLVPTVLVIAVLHGRELHAEELFHAIGRYFGVRALACGETFVN